MINLHPNNITRLYVKTGIVLLTLLLLVQHVEAKGKNEKSAITHKVLIIGLDKNVKSNYYYDELIQEALGTKQDEIDEPYNNSISNNIVHCKSNGLQFVNNLASNTCNILTDKIKVVGEEELVYSDLSGVDENSFNDVLSTAGADYLLIINQHYLRRQESPFSTLFHYVTYSLYNVDKEEVYKNNNYFTSVDLLSLDELEKSSKKVSEKIASNISKIVTKLEKAD